ncbi:hypothetical protein ACLKA7_015820 [Drosophila subpalustris]
MLVYKRLELGDTTAEAFKQELLLLCQIVPYVKHLTVNLNRHFDWTEIFITKVINALKRMTNLEHVIMWIKDKEPFGTLDPFLRSFEHLPNMKGLATYQDKAYKVLQKGIDSRKYPSGVMHGEKAITQDQETRKCLTMHW